jgi:hypothetical protein
VIFYLGLSRLSSPKKNSSKFFRQKQNKNPSKNGFPTLFMGRVPKNMCDFFQKKSFHRSHLPLPKNFYVSQQAKI